MKKSAGRWAVLAAFVGALGVGAVWSQEDGKSKKEHVILSADDIKWMEGPPSLPPGAKAAVIEGDPKKEGFFVMRVKVPAGYKVMPHWHPVDERDTVISGSISIGLGEKFDESKAKKVPAGGYFSMPAKTPHFAIATEETVLQLTTMGPWGLTYVNPEDDPRHKK